MSVVSHVTVSQMLCSIFRHGNDMLLCRGCYLAVSDMSGIVLLCHRCYLVVSGMSHMSHVAVSQMLFRSFTHVCGVTCLLCHRYSLAV